MRRTGGKDQTPARPAPGAWAEASPARISRRRLGAFPSGATRPGDVSLLLRRPSVPLDVAAQAQGRIREARPADLVDRGAATAREGMEARRGRRSRLGAAWARMRDDLRGQA